MIQRHILKLISVVVVLLLNAPLHASEAIGYQMEPMNPDGENLPSLQNGLKLYTNYCLGCHTLRFQRYERTADDLMISHEIALDQVVFTGQKIGELMVNGMNPENAKKWFGAPPPDITMVTRVRGPEWVYNYLKTFYIDESRPFGVNNKIFANVGMPHALVSLQGIQRNGCIQKPVIAENKGEKRDPLVPGKVITAEKCDELYVQEGTGTLTAEQYDAAIYDLVNFLHYVAEPSRLDRHRIGIFVLLFLVILGVFTHLLNREYWKDVH